MTQPNYISPHFQKVHYPSSSIRDFRAAEGLNGGQVGDPVELVNVTKTEYMYKYQGQERQDELGLNWDSFKWRNYMADIGRTTTLDPLAENFASNIDTSNYLNVRIKTTQTDVEKGLTDVTRPELELEFTVNTTNGLIANASLNVINEPLALDEKLLNNYSGAWLTNLMNDSFKNENGSHVYNFSIEGNSTLGINIPGKLGDVLPTSYDWNYNFILRFSNNELGNGIRWYNEKINMFYHKWGINLSGNKKVESRTNLKYLFKQF